MSKITFASFNCRGLGNFRKRKDVLAFLRSQDLNIILLQDIHCTKIGIPYFRNGWGSDIIVAPFTNNARGVAILTKNVDIVFERTHIDVNGNFIVTKMKVDKTRVLPS